MDGLLARARRPDARDRAQRCVQSARLRCHGTRVEARPTACPVRGRPRRPTRGRQLTTRAFWRGDKPLHSHAQWRGKLGKNSKQGTSAPTLAAVWGGPVELMGALRHQPEFEGLRLTHVVVEAQSSVDEFSGPRNHDLVARGELPSGERVVICVEAKAGESFGATVKQQASAAARAKSIAEKDGKTSNAPDRLEGLLERFVDHPASEPRVQNMRYQLLTALAGTLSEADERGAQHAVLMVHEFLTDERPNAEIVREHDRDLSNFVTTVFGVEPPSAQQAPWCVDVSGKPWSGNRRLYLARAISDFRTSTLESVSRVERDPERGRATAAKLKALGAKGTLVRAAEHSSGQPSRVTSRSSHARCLNASAPRSLEARATSIRSTRS